MTITRYNENFVNLDETKNLTKMKRRQKSTKNTNLLSWETKILKI